jgi:hypothetical protein
VNAEKAMKIEAKKDKFSLNKNLKKRPKKTPARDSATDKTSGKKTGPKLSKIKLPSIAIPKIQLPGLPFQKFKVPKFKGKGFVCIIIFLAVISAVVIMVWLGMNLKKHPVPKPLFTEGNLMQVPPEESNGYMYIYDNQLYNEFAQKDLGDINLFRNAASMELFLDKTRGEYTVAKTLSERDDVKKMLGLYRDIIKKPVFADAVKPDAGDAQKVRVYIALHNSITAAIITRMQERKYNAAFTLMKDQLSLNIQYLKSARSMTNHIAAMQAYDKSLNILKSMLNQFGATVKMGNDTIAVCREIGGMMRMFNPQNIQLAQIVPFEYINLWKQKFDPAIQHPEAAVQQGMRFKALVFFDRGLTQRMFDERWKKIYELAKNPTDSNIAEIRKIQEQRYTDKRFWWFRNAAGKKYLDSIAIPIYQLFQESKIWTNAINQKQGEIINIIGSLKDAVKQAKKQPVKPMKKKITRKPAS